MAYFTDISSGSSNTHVRLIESNSTTFGDPFKEAYAMSIDIGIARFRMALFPIQNVTDSDREFNEQKKLFETIPPLLLEEYRGQFIASRDGRIVDSDDDFVNLTHRFFQNAGDVPVYITKIGEDEGIFIETPFSD